MNLTIFIPTFLNKENMINLIKTLPKKSNVFIVLINDNVDFKIENNYENIEILNNLFNKGKFWSIYDAFDKIRSKYFLVIDPDDILLKNIDWQLIEKLNSQLILNDEDLIINSFYEKKNSKKYKLIKSKRIYFVFNPNSILKSELFFKNKKLISSLDKIPFNYMSDLSLIFLLKPKNNGYLNFPFYKYTYGIGISSSNRNNRLKYISEPFKIYKKTNFKKLNSKSILKNWCFKITRVNKMRFLKIINLKNNNI
ncbi:MAG: hypothetical protein TYPL_4440 [Candidatus Tyloplasma litorale]|nr:MAG: hypothetical protein TYPL_4440 [Mycoplasmatales bacterium]